MPLVPPLNAPDWWEDSMTAAAVDVLRSQGLSEDEVSMQHVYGAGAAIRAVTERQGNRLAFSGRDAIEAENRALRALAQQYRDDLHHPPAPDSRKRRLAAIAEILGPE